MTPAPSRGVVYRCPLCGAEVGVLASAAGDFCPRCCNVAMEPTGQELSFYVCPVCGAEVAVIHPGSGIFTPRCCNVEMFLAA